MVFKAVGVHEVTLGKSIGLEDKAFQDCPGKLPRLAGSSQNRRLRRREESRRTARMPCCDA